MTEKASFIRSFRFWSVLTVVSIYLLILVGGVVRATGSGMGCPDWPRCFGQWVPPTQASQLPANYKEVYTAQRVAKNQKLARTLAIMGFKQVAGDIFAHPSQYIETSFNATKTWIEYLNRLLGALIGVFVFITAVVAWPYYKSDPPVFWLAVLSWILTGVQGWLGSLVVSTNLLPIMVTIHMGLALLIVALLLYAAHRAHWGIIIAEHEAIIPNNKGEGLISIASMRYLLWSILLLTFLQIMLGTKVREQVDMVAVSVGYDSRSLWIDRLGSVFEIHRTVSALVVLANVFVGYQLWQLALPGIRRLITIAGIILGLEIIAGITLAYFALPAFVQPIHLTLATLLFGTQFLLLLSLRQSAQQRTSTAIASITTASLSKFA